MRPPLIYTDRTDLNPYFARWCDVYGHDPDALVRDSAEVANTDQRCVPDPDDPQARTLPWGCVFSLWVQARWSEWAHEKGFRNGRMGSAAQQARRAGHGDFVEWLSTWSPS